jgi:DNA-binding IclR family transcriptional regulator
MSSPSRAIAILGLFSQERPLWNADEINDSLGYSRATGYRYVKDLVDSGLLQKVGARGYALGARIIELDYQLRQSDPVLLAAAPVMEDLSRRAKLDVVLSAMFGGCRLVDTHRVSYGNTLQLHYGRGRPRPLFRGAAPKVIMAHLPRNQLLKIYEAHPAEVSDVGLGKNWKEFRQRMAEIRASGVYLSIGELDEGVGAAAVPVTNAEEEVVASLALVGTTDDIERVGTKSLLSLLKRATQTIQSTLKNSP